jgi:hydroxyethylthiazole kinase-like uncharacterized protein yjeF
MIELLTTAEMAEADRLAIASGIPGLTLMENAGKAVADCVAQRHAPGTKVAVLAGPGNNGGDGFVAARLLAEGGYRVRVLLLGSRDRLKGDAAEAARRWTQAVEEPKAENLAGAGIIIDALFGAGLDRPIEGESRNAIEAVNATGTPVLAIDLPSGINGSTGGMMGAAITAERTITFFRRKPGHVLMPGRVHCGAVTVVDIGIPVGVLGGIQPRTLFNVPELWKGSFPVPRIAAHKYARGHAIVLSGGLPHTGAARLAARGALRAGAGLVTIASPNEALAVHAAAINALMVRPVDGPAGLVTLLGDRRLNAFVLGPGGGVGEEMRTTVQAALATDRAVVLDADALTSFADEPQVLFDAITLRGSTVTILTPHEGEFTRLFQDINQSTENTSKLARARAAAKRSGGIVLLKGPDTVVAAPDGRAAIAVNAPAWLATAGSGDVLAGFVAGLLAQGMPGFESTAAAVWLHGEAGNQAGPGLIAEDLPEVLPAIYRRLLSEINLDS